MRPSRLLPVSALVTMSLWGGAPARAEEPPVVNVVPFASEHAGAEGNSLLDRQLPASREFLFRQPLAPDVDDASAELLIWPEAESPQGCQAPPARDARQFHALGMVARETGGTKSLEARVPALQVGQRFCFQVSPRHAMSASQLQALAESSATFLLTRLQGGEACFDGTSLPLFQQALTAPIEALGLKSSDVAPAALLALNRYLLGETDQCEAFSSALRRTVDPSQLLAAQNRVRQLEADLAALPLHLPPLRSPLVLTAAGQVLPAADLLVAGSSDQGLQDAANQLRGRRPGATGWEPVLSAWADALEGLGRSAPEKKQETLSALRQQPLPPPPSFELWTGSTFTPPAAFVKGHTADAERLALGTLQRLPAGPEREQWLKVLESLVRARDNLRQAQTAYQTRQDELVRAEGGLRAVVQAAFTAEDVRRQLRLQVRPVRVAPTAGSGETPSKANYAALDLGVAFAFTEYDTWFLPYVGLNLYAVPVDRTIAPSQLTGGGFHRYVLQRLSLTLGVSLSAPSTPGLTVEAPLLNRYPLAALGYRLGSYSRAVGGVLFYRQKDPNPLSGSQELKAAPFVGASLDVDLVHLLTQAL